MATLETHSIPYTCEICDVLVAKENKPDTKNKFTQFETSLNLLKNLIDKKVDRELLKDLKNQMEANIVSTDINTLQEYLHILLEDHNQSEGFLTIIQMSTGLFCLITYHVLTTSRAENKTQVITALPFILQRLIDYLCELYSYDFYVFPYEWETFFNLYIDMFYLGIPNEIFGNIHAIWKSDPTTELCLKLSYCEKVIEVKDHKLLRQMIIYDEDNLLKTFEGIESKICVESRISILVLFHILHHQVEISKVKKVKRIKALLSRILTDNGVLQRDVLFYGFYYFILTLDNKQILHITCLIKLLQSVLMEHPSDSLKIILVCTNRLRHFNHQSEYIKFMKCHLQILLSFSTDKLITLGHCYFRQQYSINLFILLDSYASCHESQYMNLVLIRLLEFRESLFSKDYFKSCYCFMGKIDCRMKFGSYCESIELFGVFVIADYENDLLKPECIDSKYLSVSDTHSFHEFDSVMENVIHAKLELVPYLQSIIEMMGWHYFEAKNCKYFMEFIKRSAEHNVATFYDIIKHLSSFALEPVIQDTILQQLTEYLIISCNEKYYLSKFILDINMICRKGKFLQKLTSSIVKLLMKCDDSILNDFRKTIYKCYCIVRQAHKSDKDENIERYKEHFAFISSMEIKDVMRKLSAMIKIFLTLFLIASDGHHKSAELKKYLSLKYEYKDSILYLLWCSGDVEINPGPTLHSLRKLPDSVKERNWIYDMCSILLRLLKYQSIDFKNDGLWKEKPLNWPTDWSFYDPRNKPKGQGYNARTDKKLLECLEQHCNVEQIFKETTKFKDEHSRSRIKQYEREIIAWKNNKTELFERYILRQEIDTVRAAKISLNKYRNDAELKQCLSEPNVDLIFDSREGNYFSSEGYTDIVRDIAITLCRICKGLNPLEKGDGIWKTPPSGWNPYHPYYSPCNAGKRQEKDLSQKLVDNLLTNCETNNIIIPSELHPLVTAWKQRNTSAISKSYTIWSKVAVVRHSLKYLKLEDFLEKKHVQQSLIQIGVILDTAFWGCPSVHKDSDNIDDEIQIFGFNYHSHNSPLSDDLLVIPTISSVKEVSRGKIKIDNQPMQLSPLTQATLSDSHTSSYQLESHTHGQLCSVEFDLKNQLNQSSKLTCVNTYTDFPILTNTVKSDSDIGYLRISSTNSKNLKEKVIPSKDCTHDATSTPESKIQRSTPTKVSKYYFRIL